MQMLTKAVHLLNRYSYGENINGGFHCRFGVRAEKTNGPDNINFVKGLEKIGPVSADVFRTLCIKKSTKFTRIFY